MAAIAALTAVAAAWQPAQALEAAGGTFRELRMTLGQALETAARGNRQLQEAVLARQADSDALRQARAGFLPTIGLGGGYDDGGAAVAGQAAGTSGVSGELDVGYRVDTDGTLRAQNSLAEAQAAVSTADVDRTRQQLRLDVCDAYYDLQAAQAQVQIAQGTAASETAQLADAQAMKAGGEGTVFDIQRAQVQLSATKRHLSEALGQQRVAGRKLAWLLGLDDDVSVAASDAIRVDGRWPLTFAQSLERALQDRPELAQQELRVRAAHAQVDLARAGQGLQTELFASGTGATPGQSQPPGVNYTVGAKTQIRLFDGGVNQAAVDRALAQQDLAKVALDDLRSHLRLEVQQAYFAMESERDAMGHADEALAHARAGLDSARQLFRAGVGTQTDVILAQQAFDQAQSDEQAAVLGYDRAIASLERASYHLGLPDAPAAPTIHLTGG